MNDTKGFTNIMTRFLFEGMPIRESDNARLHKNNNFLFSSTLQFFTCQLILIATFFAEFILKKNADSYSKRYVNVKNFRKLFS
jgi:hypothetical protein